MKVFLSVASAHVGYGGPAVSVVALGGCLAEAGVEVGLWCPDGSAQSVTNEGHRRLQLLSGSFAGAIASFGNPDIVHDNGIWWPHNHSIARFTGIGGVPRMVSPRGMLEPWARRHKYLKKTIAWWLYQKRDLQSAARIHVTADQEGNNISARMIGVPIINIPNGVALPGSISCAFSETRSRGGPRQAVFLGRLHPVKGLPMLLRAWSLAAPGDWKLLIAGPDENGHRGELEREILRLGLEGSVDFAGPVSGPAKEELFKGSELFLSPSYSESFGIAVGEALAHGLPVVTTKDVPWPQLEELACGWRVEGAVDALASALREATGCTSETLADMGKRGRGLIATEFGWNKVTERFIDAYVDMLTQKGRSDFP